jgi:hypothetical protein
LFWTEYKQKSSFKNIFWTLLKKYIFNVVMQAKKETQKIKTYSNSIGMF